MATQDVVFFETNTINLSMRSTESNKPLTANVYTLEGVTNADGSLREMSIGQLTMAVCLARATSLETEIVSMMGEIAEDTDTLEVYTEEEDDLANFQSKYPNTNLVTDNMGNLYAGSVSTANDVTSTYQTIAEQLGTEAARAAFFNDIEITDTAITGATSWTYDQLTEIMQAIEKKIDALNTLSQELLIEMQSQTSKRDDTYSLVSNVLKSLYTVLTGNANNL